MTNIFSKYTLNTFHGCFRISIRDIMQNSFSRFGRVKKCPRKNMVITDSGQNFLFKMSLRLTKSELWPSEKKYPLLKSTAIETITFFPASLLYNKENVVFR